MFFAGTELHKAECGKIFGKLSGECALRAQGRWLLTQPRFGARVRQVGLFFGIWDRMVYAAYAVCPGAASRGNRPYSIVNHCQHEAGIQMPVSMRHNFSKEFKKLPNNSFVMFSAMFIIFFIVISSIFFFIFKF